MSLLPLRGYSVTGMDVRVCSKCNEQILIYKYVVMLIRLNFLQDSSGQLNHSYTITFIVAYFIIVSMIISCGQNLINAHSKLRISIARLNNILIGCK
jgi:hypothetical protein